MISKALLAWGLTSRHVWLHAAILAGKTLWHAMKQHSPKENSQATTLTKIGLIGFLLNIEP